MNGVILLCLALTVSAIDFESFGDDDNTNFTITETIPTTERTTTERTTTQPRKETTIQSRLETTTDATTTTTARPIITAPPASTTTTAESANKQNDLICDSVLLLRIHQMLEELARKLETVSLPTTTTKTTTSTSTQTTTTNNIFEVDETDFSVFPGLPTMFEEQTNQKATTDQKADQKATTENDDFRYKQ